MKRFYCTVCRKLKRVRQYPANTSSVSAEQPEERIGECARHSIQPAKNQVYVIPDIPVKAILNQKSKRRA
jgi:hypothetical protein